MTNDEGQMTEGDWTHATAQPILVEDVAPPQHTTARRERKRVLPCANFESGPGPQLWRPSRRPPRWRNRAPRPASAAGRPPRPSRAPAASPAAEPARSAGLLWAAEARSAVAEVDWAAARPCK